MPGSAFLSNACSSGFSSDRKLAAPSYNIFNEQKCLLVCFVLLGSRDTAPLAEALIGFEVQRILS